MKLSDFKYEIDYSILPEKLNSKHNFNLIYPEERKLYFNARVGEEITALKEFFEKNTFIGYLLAPKMAGKGTYTTMLREVFGNIFTNIGVGDLVRNADLEFRENGKESELYSYANKYYRGVLPLDEVMNMLTNRSTSSLLPTELILLLIKREIDKIGRKSIFIDGFPREVDQISYSLYFRDLINYREDPDLFILINLPIEVINARIVNRRMCPICRNSCNLSLSPTPNITYENGEFVLHCTNPECKNKALEKKEGDDKGISIIEDRIIKDLQLMDMARKMHGITRIELYNALEVSKADKYINDFEKTYEYSHKFINGKVESFTDPFIVQDHGKKYVSMIPAPVVVQFIRELARVFIG